MPFPEGRVGTSEFYRITGIGKTQFHKRYRKNPLWQKRLDIRIDSSGNLHMDEVAVRHLQRALIEEGGRRKSRRAERVLRDCTKCGRRLSRSLLICPGCGNDLAEVVTS